MIKIHVLILWYLNGNKEYGLNLSFDLMVFVFDEM